MNRIFVCSVMAVMLINPSFSQEKKDLSISAGTGFFNNMSAANAKSRQFYQTGFSYSITDRHSIGTDFISGQYRYYDSIRVTSPIPLSRPGYENHTNAEGRTVIFSILYKYKVLDRKKIAGRFGTGFGFIHELYTYPTDIPNGGFTFETTGNKGLVCFPVKAELAYKILPHFQAGLICGTFLCPDYPMAGQHAGISLFYILK